MLKQENVSSFNDDSVMTEFLEILDILSAIQKLYEAWLLVNTDNWHSEQLAKSLKLIFTYVNQLASYISVHHEDIDIQISVDVESLKNKQFATVIKRTDEWKQLRKWSKTNKSSFLTQSLTVKAIYNCILAETKAFVNKIK